MKFSTIVLLIFAIACSKKEIEPSVTRDPNLPVYIKCNMAGDSGTIINYRITQKKDTLVTFFAEYNYTLEKKHQQVDQFLKVDGLIVSEVDAENQPFYFQEDHTTTIVDGFNEISTNSLSNYTFGKHIVTREDTCYLIIPRLK